MKERRKSRIVAWLLVFVILFLECGTGIVQAVEPNKEIQEDVRPEEDSEEADAYNKEDTVSEQFLRSRSLLRRPRKN